ncbi:MAG: HNH endonuclease signature motif containing protein [Nanoarchaeota archaeon]
MDFGLPTSTLGWDVNSGEGRKKRKPFKTSTKREALKRAGYKCEKCGNKLERSTNETYGYIVDFDHWDNNPSNNSLTNCKVLCLNCHRKLTALGKRKERDKMTGVVGYKTVKKFSGVKVRRKKRSDRGKKRRKRNSGSIWRDFKPLKIDLRIQ